MAADPASRPAAPGLGELLQIGAVCGFCIGAGVLLGYLLDDVLGTTPLLVFLGLAVGILGAAAGAYAVIRPYVRNASKGASETKD